MSRPIPQEFHELIELCAEKDLRIGQVIDILSSLCRDDNKDVFYVENVDLVNMLKTFLDEQNG
jgi:hypothetical protein